MNRVQERADERLRMIVRPLWTEADTGIRLDALRQLHDLYDDMVDIRAAQPAVTAAILDPEPEISRSAATLTSLRADLGADIRLAVPVLALAADHPDTITRQQVWSALWYGDSRHDTMLAQLADLARAHSTDPDEQVRQYAAGILARIAPS